MSKPLPRVFMYENGKPIEVKFTEVYTIGEIGNYYGNLELFLDSDEDGVACYWGITDWDGRVLVEPISIELYNALLDYNKCLKSNNKIDG